jgi:phosphatidylserine/phosphatidylglycerophosphate/cardiolipin synthase-like enzyme
MKSSPVLERFATTRPLAVRYLCEKQGKSQLYQLHAKTILADAERAYEGSANFTDTSLHYNFKLGLYLEDRVASPVSTRYSTTCSTTRPSRRGIFDKSWMKAHSPTLICLSIAANMKVLRG